MKTKYWLLAIVVLAAMVALGNSVMVLGQGPTNDEEIPAQAGGITAQDNVIYDDQIIDGSLCVGFDCINNENFGYDSMILKENNLRIYFYDTSTGSFPSNDWRITVNDSTNGGPSYFRIDDVTGGVSTLTILPGGNVGIGTDTPTEKLQVAGNVLVNGSMTETSDVNAKENFAPVDRRLVLDRLSQIPITSWNYKADGSDARHIGPMAQDFYAAFALGPDERHIAPLDTNGVALAAIQELYQQVQEKDRQIADLQQQNADLEARLAALENLAGQMERD